MKYIVPTNSEYHEVFKLICQKIKQGFEPTSFLYVLKSGMFKVFSHGNGSTYYEIKKIKQSKKQTSSKNKIIVDDLF